MNNAARNVGDQASLQDPGFILGGYIPKSGTARSYSSSILSFQETSTSFSITPAPVFFFYVNIIFYCRGIDRYHSFFIHLSIDRHLICFYILAMGNNDVMIIGVQIFLQDSDFISFG